MVCAFLENTSFNPRVKTMKMLQYDGHTALTTHHTQTTIRQHHREILHVKSQHMKPTIKPQPHYHQNSDFLYNAHTKLKIHKPTKTLTQHLT